MLVRTRPRANGVDVGELAAALGRRLEIELVQPHVGPVLDSFCHLQNTEGEDIYISIYL